MALDERRRYALHSAARRELGEDEGDALMELLPPVGWADVATKQDIAATKQDIAAIKADLNLGLDALEARLLGAMHAEFRRLTMHLMTILVPSLLGTIVAAFSVARFG
jgi:hypothetical protein